MAKIEGGSFFTQLMEGNAVRATSEEHVHGSAKLPLSHRWERRLALFPSCRYLCILHTIDTFPTVTASHLKPIWRGVIVCIYESNTEDTVKLMS